MADSKPAFLHCDESFVVVNIFDYDNIVSSARNSHDRIHHTISNRCNLIIVSISSLTGQIVVSVILAFLHHIAVRKNDPAALCVLEHTNDHLS